MVRTAKTKEQLLESVAHLEAELDKLQKISTKCELAVKELKESEEKFRLVTETIQDVFWMSTPYPKKMIYVSPAYETIWGRSRESLHKEPYSFLEAIHPRDRPRVFNWMKGGYQEEMEYRIVRPDASIRWIRDRGFPITDKDGKVVKFAGVASDITLLRSKHELFSRAERLAALERAVAFVAHEVRNPLQVIEMGIEMLAKEVKGQRNTIEILGELHYGVNALAEVINYLVDYALPLHLQISSLTVSEVVDEALDKVSYKLKNTKVRKELDVDSVRVMGDKEKLAQGLSNIITNSIEAMPRGGLLAIRSRNFPYQNPKRVILRIADRGCGISPENLPRVIEPFFSTKPGGVGLGLSISRKIVRAHKGSMIIRSKKNRGTTVRISLPAEQSLLAPTSALSFPE
ncbi:MAG: PAS domain S-box protein [Candidatus Abyssobacteria bacterium SURF_5]|uniref:histidine kinase n=1 Tax=Abyssobacteria bacterium (strain SURF_5) TaxID=2093360 RepID=A0A3A4PAV6_ABYX5|nr:MAG: PAS domain S-box protein [Candidatus Abyssubacteria bacterium SURF_5]